MEFEGVGPKIATIAANILVRDFKIPVSDGFCRDISVDVQVKRVFGRLGLIRDGASNEEVIYRARELNPENRYLRPFCLGDRSNVVSTEGARVR